MDPHGARFLRQADDCVLHVAGGDHHEVGQLVDHAQEVGQGLFPIGYTPAVELGKRPRLGHRHDPVAPFHLPDEVLERVGRHARTCDYRRQKVRNGLVVIQLDLLGVDEHEPHLVGCRAQEDRTEHRVDRGRLTCPRGAGDEDVGHLRQVGINRTPADVLPEEDGQRAGICGHLPEDVAERDEVTSLVRYLYANCLLARDRSQDPDVGRGQGVSEVVLEVADLVHLHPGRQPELIAGDVRAGNCPDEGGFDSEVAEGLEQSLTGGPAGGARGALPCL